MFQCSKPSKLFSNSIYFTFSLKYTKFVFSRFTTTTFQIRARLSSKFCIIPWYFSNSFSVFKLWICYKPTWFWTFNIHDILIRARFSPIFCLVFVSLFKAFFSVFKLFKLFPNRIFLYSVSLLLVFFFSHCLLGNNSTIYTHSLQLLFSFILLLQLSFFFSFLFFIIITIIIIIVIIIILNPSWRKKPVLILAKCRHVGCFRFGQFSQYGGWSLVYRQCLCWRGASLFWWFVTCGLSVVMLDDLVYC